MKISEVKIGAILSYILVALNAIYGLVITPFILGKLGPGEYGVYKSIASLSAAFIVLDIGLGGTVQRYLATFLARKEHKKIAPFVSMAFAEGAILVIILSAIGAICYFNIPSIYKAGMSVEEIQLAQHLFLVLIANMALHIIENLYNGIITGHNKFFLSNGLKLFRIIIRIFLTYFLLSIHNTSVILVYLDLLLTVGLLVAEWIYCIRTLKVNFDFNVSTWDKEIFVESFKYTGLLFLTTIAAQVNSNLDNVIIGAVIGANAVAIYSMALTLFAMFENLSTSISGVMLPTVVHSIANDPSCKEVQDVIIKAGRLQFLLLGAALVGFIVLGPVFINLWLGDGFDDVYFLGIILMLPSLFELCVNVCLSVLRAKNMLGFRTFILFSTTIMNALVTIIGVRYFGYIAAACGTALSFIVGSLIIMNFYYYKKLGFNMFHIYRKIIQGTWLSLALAGVVVFFVSQLFPSTWMGFICDTITFVLICLVCQIYFGASEYEKGFVLKVIHKNYGTR